MISVIIINQLLGIKSLLKHIESANKLIRNFSLDAEIIITTREIVNEDIEILVKLGAKVVVIKEKDWHLLFKKGLSVAVGEIVLLGDELDSCYIDKSLNLIKKVQNGYDICIGNRLRSDKLSFIEKQKSVLISEIGNFFFSCNIFDWLCGVRAFKRDKLIDIDFQAKKEEWRLEMIIKAKNIGLKMLELPLYSLDEEVSDINSRVLRNIKYIYRQHKLFKKETKDV